jgi:N-acetylglutamate synthase-like GNAT family acetyltransferase
MIAESVNAGAPELRAALQAAGLPVDDLADVGRTFLRFTENGAVVGYGGFELHAPNVLLRSIVVLPHIRGKGHGKTATDLLLQAAYDAGARHAYLLTTDAAPFFERAGFRPIPRDKAPADILATRQAASLCPSTAALLARPISGSRHD